MSSGGGDGTLDLTRFFPYRLAILAEAVSQTMAQLYADRFDLTRQEWRIVAALGNRKRMAGRDVGRLSALDKMQVSRALARLEGRGMIDRAPDPDDRRNQVLSLTAEGRALYQKIVPLVQAREEYILSALSPEEVRTLNALMTRVQARAEEMLRRG
ncbi:MAG TPA: MarR family transcriptional regulator [Beijerinckiaceae bacterium]|nr:MarR family transcriptional regulator [Beijerinckiaceae bacterium]